MAGAGFKTFNTGDVLLASEVNTYLMQQTVMVFDDATARTSALGANVAEGMFSYLKDTNLTYRYDGSAWLSDAGTTSPLTTKGDLWSYTTTDARLAVGNDGETLVADSSQTAGLRYNPPVGSLGNSVINGGFDVWQRGTSFTITTPAYTADRWQGGRNANTSGSTITRQTTSDTTNLPNIQYCVRVARDNGNSATNAIYLAQSFETVNSIPYAGKTITYSFYARKGANYSATSDALILRSYTGTGTDQNVLTAGYTGSVATNTTFTLTSTWQRFAVTVTIPTNATEIGWFFDFAPTGTAGAADYYEMTGFQIDVGTWTASTAPTFRRSGGTLAGELAACQRYYFVKVAAGTQPASFGMAAYVSSNDLRGSFSFPVEMRTTPTLVATTGTDYYGTEYLNDKFNSITIYWVSKTEAGWYNSGDTAAGTAGTASIVSSNNALSSIALNSEL